MGKESSYKQENTRFLKFATNVAGINAGASLAIALESDRSQYGNNFNTLIILNTGASNVDVYLDGVQITTINGSNGSFTFDWKDGIIYNTLSVTNIGAVAVSASALRITYGRTGLENNSNYQGVI
jgi:hypothetical protein